MILGSLFARNYLTAPRRNKTDLLILDDWLRDPPTRADAQSLLDILDDRYSRSSTLLATQFPYPLKTSSIVFSLHLSNGL